MPMPMLAGILFLSRLCGSGTASQYSPSQILEILGDNFFFFPFQFDFCRRLSTENSRGLVPNLFRTSSGGKEPASQQPHQQSHQASAGPKLGYRSMVSVDDVPELFASFDSKTTFFLKLEIVNSLTSLIPPSVSTSIPH